MPLTGSPEGKEIVNTIKRRLNVLTVAVVVLCLVVGGGVGYVIVTTTRTHDALCTLRGDLQDRVARTEDFIAHPEKYPGVKIKPSLLQPQLDSQRRTIAALSSLGCS